MTERRGKLAPGVKDIVKGTIEGPNLELIWVDTRGIPGWVSKYSASEQPQAMTIGYTTWYNPGDYTWRNLFHELKHVEQFYKYNENFIDKYTEAVWIYGYKGNKFEKQARDYADRMMEKINHD